MGWDEMGWDNNWCGTTNGMGWDGMWRRYYGMGCNNKYDAVSQWQCENSNAYCIVAVDRFIRDIIHSCMHSSLFVWTPQVYVRDQHWFKSSRRLDSLSSFYLSMSLIHLYLPDEKKCQPESVSRFFFLFFLRSFLFIVLAGYGSFYWDTEQSNRVIKWDWDQIDNATGFYRNSWVSRSNNASLILQ